MLAHHVAGLRPRPVLPVRPRSLRRRTRTVTRPGRAICLTAILLAVAGPGASAPLAAAASFPGPAALDPALATALSGSVNRLGPPDPIAPLSLALGAVAPLRPSAVPPRPSDQERVRRLLAAMTAAGDRIARRPYIYGGGHGSFDAAGYDCSGSVSYLLHAAGLLSIPMDSSGLEGYGAPGPGRHVSVFANAEHALLTIDGRRYDTIAFQETGSRWSASIGSTSAYVVRHPEGL